MGKNIMLLIGLLWRHETRLRLEWAKKYMKTDKKLVIFTEEARATLDGPDGWWRDLVANCQDRNGRFGRQQAERGVMIWEGIIGNELIGLYRVHDGVKINYVSYS